MGTDLQWESVLAIHIDFKQTYDTGEKYCATFPLNLVQSNQNAKYVQAFPIGIGMKHGHASWPLVFSSCLEYVATKRKQNQEGLKLSIILRIFVVFVSHHTK
jgi:hypothetical protein